MAHSSEGLKTNFLQKILIVLILAFSCTGYLPTALLNELDHAQRSQHPNQVNGQDNHKKVERKFLATSLEMGPEKKNRNCVGREGPWEQHEARLKATGVPDCWLGCLPFIQMRSGDTAKVFLSFVLCRQILCVFGCHIQLISDLMPEDIRYEI